MNISDQQLYDMCKKYGTQAIFWRRKFIGLLPEVFRRKLFEKKGFNSIFEFSAKLCGLSKDQVCTALNLEKSFDDKPTLKNLFVNGEVSMHKLVRVVSIATPENEQELAEKVKILSKSALETLVKEIKVENKKGLSEPLFEAKSLPGQTLEFQLSDEIIKELNELHAQGHDMNEILKQMLAKRKEEIANAKKEISENIQPANSRYVPVKIKKILQEEYGKKCSIKTCNKPAATIHHSQRFAISQNHDPNYMAPLCKEHHEIAHSIDMKYVAKKTALN